LATSAKHPTDPNETCIHKGQTYYFCPKCLIHGCWQPSHCPSDHNATNAKDIEAALENYNADSYQKYLEQKVEKLCTQPPTPPHSASAHVGTLPQTWNPDAKTLQSALLSFMSSTTSGSIPTKVAAATRTKSLSTFLQINF